MRKNKINMLILITILILVNFTSVTALNKKNNSYYCISDNYDPSTLYKTLNPDEHKDKTQYQIEKQNIIESASINDDTLTWKRTFGEADEDEGNSVQQTSDGGYILVGETLNEDWEDILLIKTDNYGDIVWERTFGEPGIQRDWGLSVIQNTDGDYVLTGMKGSLGVSWFDLCLIKVDPNGNTIWDSALLIDDFEWGKCIKQTSDGGYIILGTIMSSKNGEGDVWLIKLDTNGKIKWQKTFGGDWVDWGEYVQQTKDGGYIITARTHSFGADGYNAWLIKTDENGNMIWNRTFGGNKDDIGKCVQQTSDGGFIIAGGIQFEDDRGGDAWLIKTNENGEEIWNRTFGGDKTDWADSVQQTSDGGYILTGGTQSYGAGSYDLWLIKTDKEGRKIWDRTYGGNDWDEGNSVQQTSDGGYIITGFTYSFCSDGNDVWLLKTDENGLISNSPSKPSITGSNLGKTGEEYEYSIFSTDPEDDSIVFHINWGDNTEEKYGPYLSGETVKINHKWLKKGSYVITVKARDTHGADSELTTYNVTMMKNKQVSNKPFLRVVEIIKKCLLSIEPVFSVFKYLHC